MRIWLGAIAAILCPASPSFAQTQVQQDRLDTLARYTVTAPVCQKLGMTVDENAGDKFAAALKVETAGWSLDPAAVERLMSAAFERQGRILAIDLDAAAAHAKTAAELRRVREILLAYGKTCLAAAADPIFSRFVVRPAGFDLDRAATDLSDSMLESGGLASWQTPAIQAHGDLMMVAGACRSKIGAARSDALVRAFGTSDDPRVRAYYTRSFDDGLNDTELNFTLPQCERAIARLRQIVAGAK
jgi:hypothetical protein